MKSKKNLLIILFAFYNYLFFLKIVRANELLIYIGPDLTELIYFFLIMILFIFITILIEFFIFYFVVGKYFEKNLKLFKLITSVNLLTFPIALFLGIWLGKLLIIFIGFYFLIELIPIFLEYFLYNQLFKGFFFKHYLNKPITSKKVFTISVVGNIITFSIGLIIFLPKLIEYFVLTMI